MLSVSLKSKPVSLSPDLTDVFSRAKTMAHLLGGLEIGFLSDDEWDLFNALENDFSNELERLEAQAQSLFIHETQHEEFSGLDFLSAQVVAKF